MRKLSGSLALVLPTLLSLMPVLSSEAGLRSQSTSPKVNCQQSFDPYAVDKAVVIACGMKVFPRERVVALPDGGRESIYSLDGHKLVFKIPPKGFDPVRASATQLAFYGLPPKPTTSTELTEWTQHVSNLQPVDPPGYQVMGLPRAAATSASWSGYRAYSSSPTAYYFAEGIWNEPQALSTPCPNNTALTWAGLGGWSTSRLAQAGTGINTPGLGQHQAWWEVLPDKPNLVAISGLYGRPGWGFAAFTSWHGGFYSMYLQDFYTNRYSSFDYYTNTYDGTSADFIVERAQNNGVPLPLTNFSYVTYRDAWVNSAGTGVGSFPNVEIEMWTNGNGTGDWLAYADALTNSGQSFVDHYIYCQ